MADLTADPSANFPDFDFLLDPPKESVPPTVEARKPPINLDDIPDDRIPLLDFDLGDALMDDKQAPPRIDPIVAQMLAKRYIQEHGPADTPTASAVPPVAPPFALPFAPPQPSHYTPPSPFAALDPALFAHTDRYTQHAHRPALFSNASNPGAAVAALDSALRAKPAMNANALLDLEGALERSTESKGGKRTRENAQSTQPTAATAKRRKSKAPKSDRSSRGGKKARVVRSPPTRARVTVLTNTRTDAAQRASVGRGAPSNPRRT